MKTKKKRTGYLNSKFEFLITQKRCSISTTTTLDEVIQQMEKNYEELIREEN